MSRPYRCIRCDRWHSVGECHAVTPSRKTSRDRRWDDVLTVLSILTLAAMLAYGVTP
jgi:hypothetical protein